MQSWAAIDILRGRVVSLIRGDPSTAMEWEMDVPAAARRWQAEGVDGLHVVDLDCAFGLKSNEKMIRALMDEARVPVQVGGGIRTLEDALRWLDLGASRVVIGTMAYANPAMLQEILGRTGRGGIAVAVDFKENNVVTNGWRQNEKMNVFQAVESVRKSGVDTIIVTAVERDGMASGPDFGTYEKLRTATDMNMLASGGIRSAEDVHKLEALGLDGVILGRALYEGAILPGQLRLK